MLLKLLEPKPVTPALKVPARRDIYRDARDIYRDDDDGDDDGDDDDGG